MTGRERVELLRAEADRRKQARLPRLLCRVSRRFRERWAAEWAEFERALEAAELLAEIRDGHA